MRDTQFMQQSKGKFVYISKVMYVEHKNIHTVKFYILENLTKGAYRMDFQYQTYIIVSV